MINKIKLDFINLIDERIAVLNSERQFNKDIDPSLRNVLKLSNAVYHPFYKIDDKRIEISDEDKIKMLIKIANDIINKIENDEELTNKANAIIKKSNDYKIAYNLALEPANRYSPKLTEYFVYRK